MQLRAGQLDRTVTIEGASDAIDANGTPIQTWTTLASVRAQLLEMSSTDYMRAQGASFEKVVIFRIRWLPGVTLENRVLYNGDRYLIKDIKELGRKVGLELRCEAVT